MTTYYKILGAGAKSCHGGDLTWPLPRGKRPGKWVEVTGKIELCSNGLHVVTAEHVLDWDGAEVWEVEIGGVTETDGNKVAAQRARLVRLVMDKWALRRFAVECAARVLPIFERFLPGDNRVRDCLVVCGNPGSTDETRAVARAAASAAARAAARAADSAAASAADSVAAWAATWDAARAEEHAWQVGRFKQYLAGKVDLTKPVRLPPKGK